MRSNKIFALSAVAIMLMVSGSALLMLDSMDEAYADSSYSDAQTLTIDIRAEKPKDVTYTVVVGDTIDIKRGAYDEWRGGWLNTVYKRYVDIESSVPIPNGVRSLWCPPYLTRTTSELFGVAQQPDSFEVGWAQKYYDSGLQKTTTEDRGLFAVEILDRVRPTLHDGDWTPELNGRDSVVLPTPQNNKSGMIFAGWLGSDGTLYAAGSYYDVRGASELTALWVSSLEPTNLPSSGLIVYIRG